MRLKKISLIQILLILTTFLCWGTDIYWEAPSPLITSGVRFSEVASQPGLVVIAWQEFVASTSGGGEIYLNLKLSRDLKTWLERKRILGPFKYTDKQTKIYTLALNEAGSIYLAVSSKEKSITLYKSTDAGENFTATELTTSVPVISPRLFIKADGELLLFVTHESKTSLAIYYLVTGDTIFESATREIVFKLFVDEEELILNFLPYHLSRNGLEYVVFQSRVIGEEAGNYQLYSKLSRNNGRSWEKAVIITDFSETRNGQEVSPLLFSNQRPFLAVIDNRLHVLWERQYTGGNAQIYSAMLDETGSRLSYERITENNATCLAPHTISYQNENYILWFDNSRGSNHVFLARRGDLAWEADDLTYALAGDSQFPGAFILNNTLYLLWENRQENSNRLYLLEPDRTVSQPRIIPLNFKAAGKANRSVVTITWNIPADSSGIAGFRYSWNRQPTAAVADMEEIYKETTRLTLEATDDGTWYFRIMAGDYAGNWSAAASVQYTRDTKPPAMVLYEDLPLDEQGFLKSNTFQIQWSPDEKDDDLAGYASLLQRISTDPDHRPALTDWNLIRKPEARIQTLANTRKFVNLDNGYYAFSVITIDQVGNASSTTPLFFRLNKFIPYTDVNTLSVVRDEFGVDTVRITGRGFTTDGLVRSIFLDKDGRKPYDYQFTLKAKAYRLVNDRLIDQLSFTNIEGEYRIGLSHETRGEFLISQRIVLDSFGTMKILPPLPVAQTEYGKVIQPLFLITINELVIWVLLVLIAAVAIASLFKLLALAREGKRIREEIFAILTGPVDKDWREKQMKKIKLKGAGLRLKFTLLMSILVILILAMVSIPLSLYMIDTQRNDLTTVLRNQVKVMLGSLVSSSEQYLPLQDELELGLLPGNSLLMEEVVAATITGMRKKGEENTGQAEYIWATNDPEIDTKLKDPGSNYRSGESVLNDEISGKIPALAEKINRQANTEVAALNQKITELSEALLSFTGKTDENSRQTFLQISQEIMAINKIIKQKLQEIGNHIYAEPAFEPLDLKQFYTFYKPVVYRLRGQDIYFRGVVRLIISTDKIQASISNSRDAILTRIGIFALIALGMGILVAILLASIIIQPIQKLVAGVAQIRDTTDKSQLKEHYINIRQRDEIRMLADTINQMTQGLVRAAIANKDLIVGKETQKMFIPLKKDESGKKGTTGEETNAYVELFGYYEGAKGVSGDYFDFKKLDDKHYCVIKCDVAGKGVPAALIMVEVATIFIDHFRSWNPRKPDLNLIDLVYRINDLIEERGFKGRFAAFTIGIINAQTGVGHFCNAGDREMRIYHAAKGTLETHSMPAAPASGVFPSSLVEMQSGFQQVKYQLKKGDAFFLWTDGLDEAKRTLRDSHFKPIKCNEPGLKEGDDHGGTHNWGMADEELSAPRLQEVVNCVMNRRKYQLRKFHNPVPDEKLIFDFTRCTGTVKEAVLAMISVEKIFRLYKDPAADAQNQIIIDKKVDEFLQEHFEQYGDFFIYRQEIEDNPGYVAFTHLKEDEQYDDLTLLAIRKL